MHPSLEISCTLSRRLSGKRMVLGVTGSIAAVETVKLARLLIRHGAEVHPVMTEAAARIIHPDALEFATGRRPIIKLTGAVEHVSLCGETADRIDMLLIAPATANTISKIACGIDDTAVTTFATTALGSGIPLVIVPAMHGSMYKHKIVIENIKKLESIGVHIIDPRLEEKVAKIATNEEVVDRVIALLGPNDLSGKVVLVVTGPTYEPIDDMRVVTNKSSGTMGLALAREAYYRGAKVLLWHSIYIEPPAFVSKAEAFRTTADLVNLVKRLRKVDVALMPAAVSDFTPVGKAEKGKLPSGKGFELSLRPTPKVIHGLSSKCKVLVGFKAEARTTGEEMLQRARDRLKATRATIFVANDLTKVKHDTTQVIIIDKEGGFNEARGTKLEVSKAIMDQVVGWL
jgi:phosphopantothenoylcysteine decarboxylase/phosphopantothenate--cysteine ligase